MKPDYFSSRAKIRSDLSWRSRRRMSPLIDIQPAKSPILLNRHWLMRLASAVLRYPSQNPNYNVGKLRHLYSSATDGMTLGKLSFDAYSRRNVCPATVLASP